MSNTSIQVNSSHYLQGNYNSTDNNNNNSNVNTTNKSIQIISSNNTTSTSTATPSPTPNHSTITLTQHPSNTETNSTSIINEQNNTNTINEVKKKINVKDLLTDEDNEKINNFIIRNSKFKLANGMKFPVYFGTNEQDFKIHRMVALRNKRLHSNPIYNTNEDTQRKERLLKEKQESKKRQQKLKEERAKRIEKAEQEEKAAKEAADAKNKKDSEQTPPPTSKTETSSSSSSTTTPIQENGKKQTTTLSSSTKSPISTPLTTSWNSIGANLKNNAPSKSSSSTSTSNNRLPNASSNTITTTNNNNNNNNNNNDTNNKSVPPTSNNSLTGSTTPITQSSSNSQSSSSSEYIPMDNTLKSLGLLLFKIMFDKNMISSITKVENESSLKPHGLVNTGSICYMNAILQLLFSCEPFVKVLKFINKMSLPNYESKTPILDAVLEFMNSIKLLDSKNDSKALNPVQFYNSINKLPRFKHLIWGRQEDAEEFLGYLLDGLNEEFIESLMDTPINEINKLLQTITDTETKIKVMKVLEMIKGKNNPNVEEKTSSNNNNNNNKSSSNGWQEVNSNKKVSTLNNTVEIKPSPISMLFGGQFRSELESPNSKKASITLDPFMHIQLDIDDPNTNDLITAFNKFSEIEKVSMNNQIAKKQNFIDKLPVVLIIHLKRFSYVYDDINDNNGEVEYETVNKKKNNKNNNNNNNNISTPPPAPPTPISTYSTSSPSSFGRIEKLHKKIKYDHEFNLPLNCISKTCIIDNNLDNYSNQPRYKLIGVVYHHGRSTDGGHYTCDVLNSNKWVRIDDNIVTNDLKLDDVIENGLSGSNGFNNFKSAYLLMYQRIN